MTDNINSSSIFLNLNNLFLMYPPLLIIIYSIIISLNKCSVDLPEFLNSLFETLKNNSSNSNHEINKLKKARKDKLSETNSAVIRFMGLIALVCYLLIRIFMYKIKNIIKTNNLQCRIKTELKDNIMSKENITNDIKKIKQNKIDNINNFCKDKGSTQNTKYNKCHACITTSKDGENQCELYDTRSGNIITYENKLENNCKYYSDAEISGEDEGLSYKKHYGLYIYNNFNVFLLIMFFLGISAKNWHNLIIKIILTLSPFIIIVAVLGLILKLFHYADDKIIIWFNAIVVFIMCVFHIINMYAYNRFLS
jgi:hypothetical protein